MSERLFVVCTISNPISWESRVRLAREVIPQWVKQGAVVTVVEVAHGSRPFELADLPATHVGVRARTSVWQKESAWQIGLSRLPHDAHKIAFIDADVIFRNPDWVNRTLRALDLYDVVQPWQTCIDLDRAGGVHALHTSFGHQFAHGKPVVREDAGGAWGNPYAFPHPGYAIAATRPFLDRVGGIFDLSAAGSGDNIFFLGLLGKHMYSYPGGISSGYKRAIHTWSERAHRACAGRLGYVENYIEHSHHGYKGNRQYLERWGMFIESGFDPHRHLKRNSYGLVEFHDCPELERRFEMYLRSRLEDD